MIYRQKHLKLSLKMLLLAILQPRPVCVCVAGGGGGGGEDRCCTPALNTGIKHHHSASAPQYHPDGLLKHNGKPCGAFVRAAEFVCI